MVLFTFTVITGSGIWHPQISRLSETHSSSRSRTQLLCEPKCEILKKEKTVTRKEQRGKCVKRLLQLVMMKLLAGLVGAIQIPVVSLEFEGAQIGKYEILLTERKLTFSALPIPPKNPNKTSKIKNSTKNIPDFSY